MFRFLLKLIICLGLAIAAGLFLLALRSGDVIYSAYEWISPARFHQFDNLIRTVATEHQTIRWASATKSGATSLSWAKGCLPSIVSRRG